MPRADLDWPHSDPSGSARPLQNQVFAATLAQGELQESRGPRHLDGHGSQASHDVGHADPGEGKYKCLHISLHCLPMTVESGIAQKYQASTMFVW